MWTTVQYRSVAEQIRCQGDVEECQEHSAQMLPSIIEKLASNDNYTIEETF